MDVIPCPISQWARTQPNALFLDGTTQISYRLLDEKTKKPATKSQGMHFETTSQSDAIINLLRCIRHGQYAAPVRNLASERSVLIIPKQNAGWCLSNVATVIETGGSSGKSKLVVHTLGNHYFSAIGSCSNIPLVCGDKWLLSLPLFHISGISIVMRCLFAGATIVLKRGALVEQIADDNVSHVSLVPTQLREFTERPPSLKVALVGGAACSHELRQKVFDLDLPACFSYGSSEMTSQITTTRPGEVDFSSGTLLPHREMMIRDGEILVRGKTLMHGYVANGKFEPVSDWFQTGDLGYMKGNSLVVTGRVDNMFISGGENIYPEEVERALHSHESVQQAVVVPLTDEKWGYRPVAFVNNPEQSKLLAVHLHNIGLERFKHPTHYLPLPPQDSLKVNRKQLTSTAEALVNPR